MTVKDGNNSSDYLTYRGRCKELAEEACKADPSLRLVRGWYFCPVWGQQAHWWAVRENGEIVDPSVRQFPTKGVGAEYVEFDGMVSCEHCGQEVKEEDAYQVEHHVYCSDRCYGRDIGFGSLF